MPKVEDPNNRKVVKLTINELAGVMATAAAKALGLEGDKYFAFVNEHQAKYIPAALEVRKAARGGK